MGTFARGNHPHPEAGLFAYTKRASLDLNSMPRRFIYIE